MKRMHCCPALRALSLPHSFPPPLPRVIMNEPTWNLPTRRSSAPSTCLDSKRSCAPWESDRIKCNQDLTQPYSCQKTFTGTMGSGNVDISKPNSQKHKFHTEPDCVLHLRVLLLSWNNTVLKKHFCFCFALHLSTSHIVQCCQKIFFKEKKKSAVSDIR